LAGGDGRGRVRLWDIGTGRQRAVLEVGGRADDVCHLAFSPDGKTLGIGGQDPPIYLCNIVTGKSIGVLSPPRTARGIPTFAFSPDGKVIATWDADYVMRLWDISTGKELSFFQPRLDRYVNALAFTSDGTTLIGACDYRGIWLWEARSGKLIRRLDDLSYSALAVAVSPDGKTLATSGWGVDVRLWNLATGEFRRLAGYKSAVTAMAFSRDGKSLSAVSCDGDCRLWEVITGKERRRSPLPITRRDVGNPVSSAVFSPDGDLLAWVEGGNHIRLLRVSTGKELLMSEPQPQWGGLHFSPNDKELLTCCEDGKLCLWDATSGKILRELPYPEKAQRCWGFTPDGKALIFADQGVLVVHAETGKVLRRVELKHMRLPFTFIGSYALSRDGKTLAVGEPLLTFPPRLPRCGVFLCDLTTGQSAYLPECHYGGVDFLALSPDGKSLLTAGKSDREIRLWDTTTGKRLACLDVGQRNAVCGVGFRGDHQSALYASWHFAGGGKSVTEVACWSTATGNTMSQWKGPANSSFMGFSPRGKYAALATGSDTLAFLNAETGKEVCRFKAEHSTFSRIVFSLDERTVASKMGNSTVLIWDIGPPRGR
jgi:WD40 repeat protein